jgi:putative chitinase
MITSRAEAFDALEQLRSFIELRCPKDADAPLGPMPPASVDQLVGLQNPAAFYDYIRGDVGELFPTMTTRQFNGIQMTLLCSAGMQPLPWCAYTLATEYHETAKRMEAVREGLDVSEAWRRKHLRYYPWYGRGEVQLTWERNYASATKRLRELGHTDVDLVANPDQALDPKISTLIMIHGMLEGWFTGKKLRDYIPNNPTREHYRNARRIINGTDRADLVAGYAEAFENALKEGVWK